METKSPESSVSKSFATVGPDSELTQISALKSGPPTPKITVAHDEHRPIALMEPLKVVLPASPRPTAAVALKMEKSVADGKKAKPDKHKKGKAKRDKSTVISLALESEAPKHKKKKTLPDPEVSVLTLTQSGPLPPNDLFQTPTRGSMRQESHLKTSQLSPPHQEPQESKGSVVSVHSDSGSDDRLSRQSHRPMRHWSESSHSHRSHQ